MAQNMSQANINMLPLWQSLGNTGDLPVGWFGPGGSAGNPNMTGAPSMADLAAEQTRLRMEAIKPAVASLEASRPEISAKYGQARGQLEGEKQPTIDRYQNIIDELKGRESRDISTQGRVLSTEYGKRGIPLSSGMYEQDLASKLTGINQLYGVQQKDVGFEREGKLREITNLIQTTFSSEIEDLRGITNAIAQLQANGANQAITDALTQLQAQKQADLQLKVAELQKEAKSIEYKTVEFDKGLYSFDPTTAALNLLAKGSSTGTGITPISAKTTLQQQTGNVPTSKKPYTQSQLNNFKIFGITPP